MADGVILGLRAAPDIGGRALALNRQA